MTTEIATSGGTLMESVMRDCIAALKHVSDYRLPPAVDRRLLWLSENKESLTETEREELMGLLEFAEERTVEKLQARAALNRLSDIWPHLIATKP